MQRASNGPDRFFAVRKRHDLMDEKDVSLILRNKSYRFRRAAELIAAGYSNAEIAGELGCALRTAKAYTYRVYRALGLARLKNCARRVQVAELLRSANANHNATTIRIKPKHQRIIAELRSGKSNGEIATALSTTENVVKNYMRDLMDLSGMSNRVELANWAAAHEREIVC